MDPTQPPGIEIAQIFLEEAHFSHREDYLSLPPNAQVPPPTVQVNFEGSIDEAQKLGVVRVGVSTNDEERPYYNIRVTMTAVVRPEAGKENMPVETYLRGPGPAMLYGFLREVVANLTWRGRFGPIWLSPFNIQAAVETSLTRK